MWPTIFRGLELATALIPAAGKVYDQLYARKFGMTPAEARAAKADIDRRHKERSK